MQKSYGHYKEIGGSENLTFRHIDRMSENLLGVLSIEKPAADSLMRYALSVHHLDALLAYDLHEKEYYAAYDAHIKPDIDKISWNNVTGDVVQQFKFFLPYKKWFKLLVICAKKKGYLGKQGVSQI